LIEQLSSLKFISVEIIAISKQGTAMAHAEGGVPIIQLELERLDAYHLGYLLYFS
jgi:glucose-6-phosphate isomerase